MTVKELIELLQEKDPNTMVIITGYEGGYKEISGIDDKVIALNANLGCHYKGKHEEYEYAHNKEDYEKANAIQIW